MTAKTIAPIKDTHEFEHTVETIAALIIDKKKRTAALATKIAKLQENEAQAITDLDAEIASLTELAEAYARPNREPLLGKAKSKTIGAGKIAFRKVTGTLTTDPKWSQTQCILALEAANLDTCVRVKKTLDKEAIKDLIEPTDFEKYGLAYTKLQDKFTVTLA